MLRRNAPKVIFIDIDGTLIYDGHAPSELDVKQLRAARREGNYIFLNTGRSYSYIPSYLREADYIDGIIAGGGAHIVVGREHIYQHTIEEDVLCDVSELYLSLGKWCLFEGIEQNYSIAREGPFLPVEYKDDFRTRYKGALISKITMQGEVGEEERQVLHPHFYLYRQTNYSEGFIRGVSKTSGIERVLEVLGVDKKQTVGIGDSLNDIEMLINTEFGVAMGNACPELKQIADVITDDCRHSGVGKAIEQYLLEDSLSMEAYVMKSKA